MAYQRDKHLLFKNLTNNVQGREDAYYYTE